MLSNARSKRSAKLFKRPASSCAWSEPANPAACGAGGTPETPSARCQPVRPVAWNQFLRPLPPPPRPKEPKPLPRFIDPGTAKPEQYPAPRPVLGPCPNGPVLSPNGICRLSPFPLRSRHRRTALRACHLIARPPDRVRQLLTTSRAHAGSAWSGGRRSAHSSASAAGATTPAATRTHSKTSRHHVSPCLPQALPPRAATGHRKFRLRDISVQKSRDNLVDRPAQEPDHMDAR
jgi:hypothetical protein